MLASMLIDITENKYIFFIIVNIFFLILGMFLEGGASMVIFAPILAPVAQALGIDMIHFGLVMVFNITIGCITPPFGIILFLVAPLLKIPVSDVVKEIWPFIALLIFVLLLITFCPILVTFVPDLLFG